jgi:hypothetical protein
MPFQLGVPTQTPAPGSVQPIDLSASHGAAIELGLAGQILVRTFSAIAAAEAFETGGMLVLSAGAVGTGPAGAAVVVFVIAPAAAVSFAAGGAALAITDFGPGPVAGFLSGKQ